MISDPLSVETLTGIFKTSPKDPMRIINREGSTIEFKESYNHRGMAQYFKTMAAFANNTGGYIIFGVGDKPRRLLGLKEHNLSQFEDLKVEEFTKHLVDYFSPEIKWSHCTFEYKEMSFGVIYTFALGKKPCICKKAYDDQDAKHTLREGDIYYRYGGRSDRIHYEELSSIVDEARKSEEQQWIDFARRVAKIGIDNACLLDLNAGEVSGKGGSIIIDENLLSKLAFIKEGEFVETKGTPTLRLIGDIQDVSTGKIVVKESTKRVVKAIEVSDIVKAFLQGDKIEEPLEYLKTLCFATSGYYPIYFLLYQAKEDSNRAIEIIEATTSREKTKQLIMERLRGKTIELSPIPTLNTQASIKKGEYRKAWENENVDPIESELNYCLGALLSLHDDIIKEHEKYIRERLLVIYNNFYESAKSTVATAIRKSICRVDEVLYLQKKEE